MLFSHAYDQARMRLRANFRTPNGTAMGSRRKAILEFSHCANILLSPTKRSIFPNSTLSTNAFLASQFCSSTFSRSSTDGTPVENEQPRQSNRDSTLLEKFRLRKLKGLSKISQDSPSSNGGEKAMTGFRDLGLCNELGEAVEKMGVLAPSELDCAGIPAVLEGKNVVFGYLDEPERALAYLLPLIQIMTRSTLLVVVCFYSEVEQYHESLQNKLA